MTRHSRSPGLVVGSLAVLLACTPAWAQPDDNDAPSSGARFDPTTCKKQKDKPGKPAADDSATESAVKVIPVGFNDYEITGELLEPVATVRALLGPTLDRYRALSDDAREKISEAAMAFGYHVIKLGTRETATGLHGHLHLAPRPIVRRVEVDTQQSLVDVPFVPLLKDEVRRRMRMRPGAYLPWAPDERACLLHEEKRKIEEFLHDEGFFEAVATIRASVDGVGVNLEVEVRLGKEYVTDIDKIAIPGAGGLPVDAKEIREKFHHRKCVIRFVCFGKQRFTRAQHQADVQKVVELFQARGFPAVRVRSDFAPGMSIDRSTKTVQFTITIDPRRRIDVAFEGQFSASTETLQKQLTFDKAASADDVEAHDSARAIAAYLQSRGYFDARVTWRREPFPEAGFDRIVYRIDQGKSRTVRSVVFSGNRALDNDVLAGAVGTKPQRLSTSILGSTTAATSALLAGDVDRLVSLYRRSGYRDVRIHVNASTDPSALGSAALTAALLAADRGSGLFIRFTIEEGFLTRLTEVHVALGDKGDLLATDEERALCDQVLRDLADFYHHKPLANRASRDRCVGHAANTQVDYLAFREDDATDTRDRLKERLFSRGRPRAEVKYEPSVIGPHQIAAHYTLRNVQELKVGKIVIRGNFRTRGSIIMGELKLKEGQPLTTDALAESTRRLRNTSLFDAVIIHTPDLKTTSVGSVNAVVEITERYDYLAQIDVEGGYSSFNGAFIKLLPGFKNLFGIGVSLDLAGTVGFDVSELIDRALELRQLSAEAILRIPQYLSRRFSPVEFGTELTGFHRRQDTPRFGLLRTTGVTVALSRTWDRQRLGKRPARALTFGVHYDFRSRERNVDALRPIGADDDDSQVPITTRTGSVGLSFEWEQRIDRSGSLSPLAPESGFRFETQVSFASPYLFGQDTFIKASVAGSRYVPVGPNLVLRADLRYDHGFPLGGAALLPEVERFFGGGDSTVRGYNDDRLATEIVQVGVPPLDNITQIRILPAGGNIRVLGSVDAQLRIYKLLSTALFADAGIITNQWSTVTVEDIRPSVGMALVRIVTPFGSFAFERAVPLRPRLGDDPRGRWHLSFAARTQF